jgi:hypothetical protein
MHVSVVLGFVSREDIASTKLKHHDIATTMQDVKTIRK